MRFVRVYSQSLMVLSAQLRTTLSKKSICSSLLRGMYRLSNNGKFMLTARFVDALIDPRGYVELCISLLDSYGVIQMTSEDLANAVLDLAYESDGKLRLDCAQAFVLARKLRVKPAKIAELCNRHNIRISKCQLGCFS